MAGLAEAGIDGSLSTEAHISSTLQQSTDFIWAVRLAKISKGLLDRRWSYRTFSHGATFASEQNAEEKREFIKALQEEGVNGLSVHGQGDGDELFIVNTDLDRAAER